MWGSAGENKNAKTTVRTQRRGKKPFTGQVVDPKPEGPKA